jgi:hypothetical protein
LTDKSLWGHDIVAETKEPSSPIAATSICTRIFPNDAAAGFADMRQMLDLITEKLAALHLSARDSNAGTTD